MSATVMVFPAQNVAVQPGQEAEVALPKDTALPSQLVRVPAPKVTVKVTQE